MGVIQKYKKLLFSHAPVQQPAPRRRSTEPDKVIAITIAVPSWHKLPLYDRIVHLLGRIPLSNRTKTIILIASASVVLYSYNLALRHSSSLDASSVFASPQLEKGNPPYDTILPKGKNIEELGGWTRISPPDRDPVYTYTDKIGYISLNVSEQPLPKDFQSDPDKQVENLARDFNATGKITVSRTVVYIGTTEGGPQSVIFHKDGLLVLIKSTGLLDNNQWAKYINSLQ